MYDILIDAKKLKLHYILTKKPYQTNTKMELPKIHSVLFFFIPVYIFNYITRLIFIFNRYLIFQFQQEHFL
jgi:hypothetical protein